MISINENAAVDLVMRLISIPGGSCRESAVSEFIRSNLTAAGIPESAFRIDTAHKRSPAGGETGNLFVRLKGTRPGPRRLLMAHMDTVPIAVGAVPVHEGDWIRPKSAATALGGDNRAGCAVVLTAISEILNQQLDHPPLTLLFTVQEEIGLRGARFLTASHLGRPELCFNWDGRQPGVLITGAVGACNLVITVSGIASHAGVHPESGVNALVAASMAIADLQQNGWHGRVIRGKRRGTSNFGIISGGDATNVVMPEVRIEAEARSHDARFCRQIVREFEKAFRRAVRSLRNSEGQAGQLTFEEDLRYDAFRIDQTTECVRIAVQTLERLGIPHELKSSDGGLDANWISAHGFPTVTLGCGQHDIHTVRERLFIPEFLSACRIAVNLAAGLEES